MDTDSGITSDEPEHDVNTDAGFKAYLRSQAGGSDLPASVNELGAPNSAHRKSVVQRSIDEGWKKAEESASIKRDLDGYFSGPGQGDVQAGLELPDDTPPAAAPVVDTAAIDKLKSELTASRSELSELQQHEAKMLAYDSLEEALDETDVSNTLSELRAALPAEEWSAFKLEAVGGGLVEPEELERYETQYSSERAFEQAHDQAQRSQAEADALAQAQWKVLEGEQKRLGLNEEAWTAHLVDVAEAAGQLGADLASLPKDEYETEIKNISALVADARRAYKHAWIQEQILGSTNSVEEGLTIMGQPVNPREPIEPELDYARLAAHTNIGRKVDIAAGVAEEERKSRSLGEDIAALARKTSRDLDARQARARKARGGF